MNRGLSVYGSLTLSKYTRVETPSRLRRGYQNQRLAPRGLGLAREHRYKDFIYRHVAAFMTDSYTLVDVDEMVMTTAWKYMEMHVPSCVYMLWDQEHKLTHFSDVRPHVDYFYCAYC